MDPATRNALTEIIEAQVSLLRAVNVVGHFSPDTIVKTGVQPLIEDATAHLEAAMKVIADAP